MMPPVVDCWDMFVFNAETCEWINEGEQDMMPPVVDCWDMFVFNTETCEWINMGIPQEPNAGIDGFLTVCEGTTPTNAELFAQLGETPDAGGTWSAPENGVYTYTVTAIEPCTFDVSATVTVTLEDCNFCSQPVLVGDEPADSEHSCADACPAAPILEFTDILDDDLVITFTETTEDIGCGQVITRTWTATNFCGNSVTVVQVLSSYDNIAPVVQYATPDMTISCSDDVPEVEVIFIDNCDTQLTVVVNTQIQGFGCNLQIIKTCVATDNCGNSISATTVITIVDTTAPLLIGAPEDMTVDCNELPSPVMLEATDNCDTDVQVTFTEEATGACDLIRTWTALDDCGNISIHTQTIQVVDTIAPDFGSYEIQIEVSCDEFSNYEIEVSDECSEPILTFQDTPFSGGCLGITQRIWTATDACGNSSSAVQFIHLVDEINPVLIDVPEDLVVQCGENIPQVDLFVSATDNCDDDLEISFTEEVTSEFCPYVITRTWTATDDCGNTAEGTQVITIELDTPDLVSISCYPNPFNDSFTVTFSVPQNAVVNATVIDGFGRIISVIFDGYADGERLYEYKLSGLNWAPGSYVLMMVVDGEVHHHKLMVQDN
jgi:hypothetical protein